MDVVEVEIRGEPGLALRRGAIGEAVGPFAEKSLDDALDLAVGSGGVGFDAVVAETEMLAEVGETVGTVGGAVVGHDALDEDAVVAEPGESAAKEGGDVVGDLIGKDLGVGQTGGIVDRDVDELPALTGAASRAGAGNAMADTVEAAEALDVEVNELAGVSVLVSARGRRGIDEIETVEACGTTDSSDRRRADGDDSGDPPNGHSSATETEDAIADRGAVTPGVSRSGATIDQRFVTLGAAEPFTAPAFTEASGRRRPSEGPAKFEDTFREEGSTSWAASRILVDVHLGPFGQPFELGSF